MCYFYVIIKCEDVKTQQMNCSSSFSGATPHRLDQIVYLLNTFLFYVVHISTHYFQHNFIDLDFLNSTYDCSPLYIMLTVSFVILIPYKKILYVVCCMLPASTSNWAYDPTLRKPLVIFSKDVICSGYKSKGKLSH